MRRRPSEAGFTLIEIMVTIVLMSVTLLVLAPLTLKVARLSNSVTLSAQRTGALAGEASRIEALSYEDLVPGSSSCTDYSAEAFPHTTCMTVTQTTATTRQITVIVTPLSGGRADTTYVEKNGAGDKNPLDS